MNVWVNFLVFVAAAVGMLLLTFERLFQLKDLVFLAQKIIPLIPRLNIPFSACS